MAKKFVYITQTYHVIAIMDINPKETYEDIQKRIYEHVKNSGGTEAVINCGGEIEHEIMDIAGDPDREDEERFECID